MFGGIESEKDITMEDQAILHDKVMETGAWLTFLVVLFLAGRVNYLLFHSLAEVFSIAISWCIFLFAFNSRRFVSTDYFIFLGVTYLFIGFFDLLHTLAYKGMGVFPGYDANLPTQLWIATRFMESLALLAAPWFINRKLNFHYLILTFLTIGFLLLSSLFVWHNFPDCFVEGTGLTPFKKRSEYLISLILAAALAVLWRQRREFDAKVLRLLMASIILTILSELSFTFYVSVYGLSNLVGHFFKIVSFYCIYRAIIATGLESPYSLLLRKVKQHELSLQKAHDELEKRVEERTTELREANLNLRREIKEREAAEEKIRRAKVEWDRTFNSISDMVTVLDPRLRIARTNEAIREYFETGPAEAAGRYCYHFFHNRDEICPGCPAFKTLEDGETHEKEIEYAILNKTFLVTTSPILTETGEFHGVAHIAKDITETKKLSNQLRQSQKMEAIGTLAGGIAHDFNNILTAILGYGNLVKEQIPLESQVAADQEMVLQAAERAKQLVGQILSFSRRSEQELAPVQIQLIIKEALKLLRSSLPANIEIRQDIDNGCEAVMADPTQIHQVLMNLCTNAYQAMGEKGGVLQVSLAPIQVDPDHFMARLGLSPGPYLKLEVSDTGTGMDKQTLDHIFEPYFTTKPKGEGTGLGLSVTHGIVKNHHGHITVYSEPDRGTSFHIYLPCLGVTEGSSLQEVPGTVPGGTERLLVVDDEEAIAGMLERVLGELGYRVTAFTDCNDAFKAFEKAPGNFDLAITDLTMPGMLGTELAAALLTIRPDLPIILCTGYGEKISEGKAKGNGIRQHVLKPVSKREIALAVRKVLDIKG